MFLLKAPSAARSGVSIFLPYSNVTPTLFQSLCFKLATRSFQREKTALHFSWFRASLLCSNKLNLWSAFPPCIALWEEPDFYSSSWSHLKSLWFSGLKVSEEAFGVFCWYPTAGTTETSTGRGKKVTWAPQLLWSPGSALSLQIQLTWPCISASLKPHCNTGLLDFRVLSKLVKLKQVKTWSIKKK